MGTDIKELGTGILYIRDDRTYYVDSRRNWRVVRGEKPHRNRQRQSALRRYKKASNHTSSTGGGGELIHHPDCQPEEPEPEEQSTKKKSMKQTLIELSHIDWSEDHQASSLLDSIADDEQ